MRVYKCDGTYEEDVKDTEFGWYCSEIAIDEADENYEEHNRQTKNLAKLRKSLTKENLLESIDLPLYNTRTTSELSEVLKYRVPVMKAKLSTHFSIKNVENNAPSKEQLANMINPCNSESKMLLSVVNNAKYKRLIQEETEVLPKTVNFKTTHSESLLDGNKSSFAKDMYNEIRNYHAHKEENMMSLMMELILADNDGKLDNFMEVPESDTRPMTMTKSLNSITATSDLGVSIQSNDSSKETQDTDYLTVSSRSNMLSSIGLSEEDKSIQDFCMESYEMYHEVAKIRGSFQDCERKVDKLVKEASNLDKDLRETQYLDDILHLLSNDLEKVKLIKLPFKLFHQSNSKDQEFNFVV